MKPGLARALVALSAGAVLVLEILAGRLLAPYVGVTLETFTGIIGVVLAGIALGAWVGGAFADAFDARKYIGAAIGLGGALSFLVLPILGALGPRFGDGSVAIVTLSGAALFLPAAVLSTVSPMVAKLALEDLGETGAVVGGLSAAGTLGALGGTFVTGFVLVAALPTRLTVMLLGGTLIAIGAVTHLRLTRTVPDTSAVVLALACGLLGVTANQPCQYETGYFCVAIVHDVDDSAGRSLYLDGLRHAYVDLDDPTNLDIRYIRLFATIAGSFDPGPLDSLHIGGGGFSFPRYIEHVRPGSTALAIEIDPHLVTLVEAELGLVQTETLRVHIGDARLALDDLADRSFDLVVGDAFGSRAIPWHLTTREFLGEVDRVLGPGGLYIMNVIDDAGSANLVRAELATLQQVFSHVKVIGPPGEPRTGGLVNYVLVAGRQRLPGLVIDAADGRLLDGDATQAFVGDASPLRDDFAPVDQLQE